MSGPSAGSMPPPPPPAGKEAMLEREAKVLSSCFKASMSSVLLERYVSSTTDRGRKDWPGLCLPRRRTQTVSKHNYPTP